MLGDGKLIPQPVCVALDSLQNTFLYELLMPVRRTHVGGDCSPGNLERQAGPRSVTEALTLAPKEVTVYRGTLMSVPKMLNGF